MGTLIVAAGGGGDAITASALASALRLTTDTPVILTYSWDRLLIDPLPGPRHPSDFAGLHQLGPDVLEVLPTSRAISPAGSSLPQLAAELPSRLLLLNPERGAVGMAAQIEAAAKLFGADDLALVDVGGDVLTTGTEPGLRSPLADLLALAACTLTGRPVRLLVPAPGVDGELDQPALTIRLVEFNGKQIAILGADTFQPIQQVFNWHPSEASGLLAAAAAGIRGFVEVRDAGDQIHLTDDTPAVFELDGHKVVQNSPATHLRSTDTLSEAERIVHEITGVSEIAYETAKAASFRDRRPYMPTNRDLKEVDRHASSAAHRSANYVTVRRLAELLGATTEPAVSALRQLLVQARSEQYYPPLYRVMPPSGGPRAARG
jgi:hypothetical protein